MNLQRFFAGLAIVTSFCAVGATTSAPAHAWCDGQNVRRTAVWDKDGVTRGYERSISGTCNSNNTYSGNYIDNAVDQRDVYVQATINGVNVNYPPNDSTVTPKNYSFHDSNKYAPIKVCMDGPNSCDSSVDNRGF